MSPVHRNSQGTVAAVHNPARSGASEGPSACVGLKSAAARCRELGPSFRLALTLLEHSEWLIGQGRAEEGEPLLVAVRETLERLEAKPWPEHAAQSQPERRTEAVT